MFVCRFTGHKSTHMTYLMIGTIFLHTAIDCNHELQLINNAKEKKLSSNYKNTLTFFSKQLHTHEMCMYMYLLTRCYSTPHTCVCIYLYMYIVPHWALVHLTELSVQCSHTILCREYEDQREPQYHLCSSHHLCTCVCVCVCARSDRLRIR